MLEKMTSTHASGTKNVDELIPHNVDDLFTVVGTQDDEIEKLNTAPYSYWKITFRNLFKNPLVIVCLFLLFLIVFFTIFGPMIHSFKVVPFDEADRFGEASQGYYVWPNTVNWFGVCGHNMGAAWEGLDMWSVVWEGARLSLLLGVVVALIDTFLGILIGSLWGYFKWLDPIMLEIRNFVNNVPSILLNILFMQLLVRYVDDYAFLIVTFLLTMFGWLGLASFIRNQIIIIRNREYNIASQTLGSSSKAMITHNLLPYLVSVIVTVASTSIPAAISSEVGLAFFGLSFKISKGDITLGQVLTQATQGATATASGASAPWMEYWYLLVAPLVVLVPLTVAFFYLGLALSDATDPKNHR